MPNKKGLWLYSEVVNTGKPLYDFRKQDSIDMPMGLYTYSQIKEYFNIKMSEQDRIDMIWCFKITKGTRGCVPLYRYDFGNKKFILSYE